MPKLLRVKRAGAEAVPLTVAETRVLGALSAGGAHTRSRIELLAGTAGCLAALERAGRVLLDSLDLDGVIERVWVITEAGREALAAVAPVSLAPAGGSDEDGPAIGGLAPWFGSARRQAAQVGEAMRGCKYVGVPFAGSLCEVPAILTAGVNAVGVNDKHRHLVNMARCIADPRYGATMLRRLRRAPFCIEELRAAQARCADAEPAEGCLDVEMAVDYFCCCWLARSAEAGKLNEFRAGLGIRYGAGGGNSVLRFCNAVGGIPAWQKILQRCSLSSDDAFDFIERINDRPDAGIYADPPWPGPGDGYLHRFSEAQQEQLAETLTGFQQARVVVRAGEHPTPRRLYREADGWQWLALHGRNQGNREATEWLIVHQPTGA